MSFFKKLKAEWKELVGDDDDKERKTETTAQHVPGMSNSHPPVRNTDYSADHSYTGQKDLTQPQPGQFPSQYGQPPQQHSRGSPRGTQIPLGWVQQWDSNSQRYYYIDPNTGRTQWDPPTYQHQGYGGPPPPLVNNQMSGYGNYSNPQAQYGGNYSGEVKEETSGKGGLIVAGVGGAAVGALGAAALSGDPSDDEHHVSAPYGAPPSGGYYPSAAPPVAPVPLEDNHHLSSSQRSSLEEAREDMEEAEAKVRADSSASSSDIEELEEAREKYASEVESAHEELED